MNKFMFLGRLTKDVVLRDELTFKTARMTLAVQRRIPNKNGERETDFFEITLFGKLADFSTKYLGKGRQVLVEGRIQNNNYKDKETGKTVYGTSFVADNIFFADSGKSSFPKDNGYVTIEDDTKLPF